MHRSSTMVPQISFSSALVMLCLTIYSVSHTQVERAFSSLKYDGYSDHLEDLQKIKSISFSSIQVTTNIYIAIGKALTPH